MKSPYRGAPGATADGSNIDDRIADVVRAIKNLAAALGTTKRPIDVRFGHCRTAVEGLWQTSGHATRTHWRDITWNPVGAIVRIEVHGEVALYASCDATEAEFQAVVAADDRIVFEK